MKGPCKAALAWQFPWIAPGAVPGAPTPNGAWYPGRPLLSEPCGELMRVHCDLTEAHAGPHLKRLLRLRWGDS